MTGKHTLYFISSQTWRMRPAPTAVLNIAGDVVMTLTTPGHVATMSPAKAVNGRINIGGWLRAEEGAGGSPCNYGSGTIRAYGIYNDTRYPAGFRLCNGDTFHWEIGAGGLLAGPNIREGIESYSCAIAPGNGVEIKALADFPVQGDIYTPLRI